MTLGEQVQAFIDWRKINSRQMAELVQRHYRRPERPVVRQDIEGITKGGIETPRFLVALAAAMDTSAEILAGGRYRTPDGDPPHERQPMVVVPEHGSSRRLTLEEMAEPLSRSGEGIRKIAGGMLAEYAMDPIGKAHLLPLINQILAPYLDEPEENQPPVAAPNDPPFMPTTQPKAPELPPLRREGKAA